MINKECFTARWIEEKSKELNYPDKNIIEKVIHAFSLLDMLAASGCPFHFKGGSSLMLLLKEQRHRLSIDIDIICPPGTEIEEYLQSYKDYGFIDYKPIERIQRGTDIPKSHSKFFYQVAFLDGIDRKETILLDVLNEDCHYNEVVTLPVESRHRDRCHTYNLHFSDCNHYSLPDLFMDDKQFKLPPVCILDCRIFICDIA